MQLNKVKSVRFFSTLAFIAMLCGFLLSACSGGGATSSGGGATLFTNAITSYSINGATGVISGQNIAVALPFGTSVGALVATYTTTGNKVTVGGTVQVSGSTPNNFTSPVIYIVTAATGGTQSYTVTVTVASNSANAITSYSINGATGVIVGQNIAVILPFGTSVGSLVATFVTTGSSVTVGGVVQLSNVTANNFTSPVTYTVTAANGTVQSYIVTVTVAPSSGNAITSYSINGATGVIAGQSIAVTLPFGTSVGALVATFVTTGSSVTIGGTVQVSGSTANNFVNTVTYTVTAADGTLQNYTVTVTVASSSGKAITFYSINGVTGTITGQSITVNLPYGTGENLAATFTTTGSSVTVGGTVQVSGSTLNNFTNLVTYTVTAADSTAQNYTVTVSVATYQVLYSFGTSPDGNNPYVGPLMQATNGNLYGTTVLGGSAGGGTVFRVNPTTGAETVIHSFGIGSDGTIPFAGLMQATDSNLYGATVQGGTNGRGAVFRINPTTGVEAVIYSFTGGSDGQNPEGGLMQATDGNLYGTTDAGSIGGTVFRINPTTGILTTIHTFVSGSDGSTPIAELIQATDGNLYGTTTLGGTANFGTVFRINPTTGVETVIHTFTGGPSDGQSPLYGSLVQATDGNLYGTTGSGGSTGNGTVFRINPTTGVEAVIYSFNTIPGVNPTAGLIQAIDGNLYGTTTAGGGFYGTVFSINPANLDFLTLYIFYGVGSDGRTPNAGLLQARDGYLYGTTYTGGVSGFGTIFKI